MADWRKVLLETPSGFALFAVNEDVLKETNDIWVYFRNVPTAKHIMVCHDDVQFADKSVAWDGETEASREFIDLIRESCSGKKALFVQSAELKAVIENKLGIQCSYESPVVDELIWGMKHVLCGFISYDEDNEITMEYCLPLSKGLQQFLQDHLINIKPNRLHDRLISEVGLLRYVDTTLEQVPKSLRESFDEHVCRIGESIEDDLEYARVLAKILVPEWTPEYDFRKMFPLDLVQKINDADKHAAKYRKEKLTIRDREIIMGALSHLLAVPKQRNEIMIDVKRMESEITYLFRAFDCTDVEPIREPANLNDSTYRRALLETPSGFAMFDVCEDVFKQPQHIWASFISEVEARGVVLALGFVKVDSKKTVRDKCHGPDKDLSRFIRKLRPHGTKLIVQDDDLKSVIEEKLKVQCCTKFSNDDDGVGDLMWGLKHVLHEFIPQEKDNLIEDYYLPMSKGLQNMLQLYGISVSPGQMDRQFIFFLGYLEHLDWVSSVVPLIFRRSFDPHVSYIGILIEDDVDYANVVARILVPESEQKIDVESLSSDLKEKVSQLAANVNKQGKSINDDDKQVILAVRGYLSDVREKKDKCLQFLKHNGSEVELPIVGEAYDDEVNSWLMSLTEASPSEKLTVADMPMPCQMGEEGQGDIEGTKEKAAQGATNAFPEAENTGKSKSEDKSAQAYDSFENVPNIDERVEPCTGKSVGTDGDLLKFVCRSETPAISQGSDNANQHHYPVTAIAAMNVCSTVTMDDSMQKDMSSDTVMPSQAKVLDLGVSATEHGVNIVGRTNFIDMENGKGGTGGTFNETNKRHVIEIFEEKQLCKEAIAVPIPDKTDAILTVDNSCENGQNETEANSCKIGPKQDNEQTTGSAYNVRERKDKGNADPTSHKTNGAYTTGNDDELKNEEPFVDPTFSNGTTCIIGGVGDNKQNESATGESNTLVDADGRVVYSTDVNDKTYGQNIAVCTSVYSADVSDEETSVHSTSYKTKGCTTEDQKNGETLVDSTSSISKSRIDKEDKEQSEEDHPSSCTYDTGYKKKKAGAIACPVSNETEVSNVFKKGRMEDTGSKAINTNQIPDEIKVSNDLTENSDRGSEGADKSEVVEDATSKAINTDQSEGEIELSGEDRMRGKTLNANRAIVAMNVCSSVTMDDSMQKDMSSDTVMPSQAKVLDLGVSATEHEVNIVGRTNFVDMENGKGGTGGTFNETNKRHVIEIFEEKQLCKEAIAVPIPDKSDAILTVDNSCENEQNETEANSCKIGPKQDNEQTTGSAYNARERKDKGNADPTSHKKNGAYTTGNDDELKNEEPFVDPTFSNGTTCSIGGVGDNKQNESATGESNTLVRADGRVVYSTDVNDKTYGQNIAVCTSVYSADVSDEETSVHSTSYKTKGCTTEEQKNGETLVDSTSSISKSRIDNEDKEQSEEDHPSSCTYDTGYKKKNAGAITCPVSNETEVSNVFKKGRMEDTGSKAINTNQIPDEIKVSNDLTENSDRGSEGADKSEVVEDATSKAINTDQSEGEIELSGEDRMRGKTLNANRDHDPEGAAKNKANSGSKRITLHDLLDQENNDLLGQKNNDTGDLLDQENNALGQTNNNAVGQTNNDTKKKRFLKLLRSLRRRSSSKDNGGKQPGRLSASTPNQFSVSTPNRVSTPRRYSVSSWNDRFKSIISSKGSLRQVPSIKSETVLVSSTPNRSSVSSTPGRSSSSSLNNRFKSIISKRGNRN